MEWREYYFTAERLGSPVSAGDADVNVAEADGVYSTDYGFALVHPDAQGSVQGHQREYQWNERNLLRRVRDSRHVMEYRYGADGERAVKYGSNGNQTLYFNGMVEVSRHHNLEWVESKHIYVGDTRIATKRRHEGNDNYGEEERSIYYYHGDHLGSAQLVTDYRGEVYEHLEYTPYGELWVEEVRAGGEKTPFRFTGKRLDEETGLYYYGARYLDPQTSRWLSTDPAMGEYIPQAPVDEEARKRNGNLPGMGGVYNTVNLHVYHYAGNNPIKYIDPDGEWVVNNIAVGQNKTRDFASNPKILKSVDRHYFGGCQGGFVFDSHSVTMSNKPRKLFSSNFTRIELENGLNDFIKKSAEYNNDNNSRSSGILTAREERMDNGIYEIKATITVRDGVSTPRSRTGTIAFAGFSEISTDGQIDQAKVYAIAYKTVEYTYQAMEK